MEYMALLNLLRFKVKNSGEMVFGPSRSYKVFVGVDALIELISVNYVKFNVKLCQI